MAKKRNRINKNFFLIIFFIIILFMCLFKLINKPRYKYNEKISILFNNENITDNMEDDLLQKNSKTYMSYNDVKNILFRYLI